jgi:hypothetical protein
LCHRREIDSVRDACILERGGGSKQGSSVDRKVMPVSVFGGGFAVPRRVGHAYRRVQEAVAELTQDEGAACTFAPRPGDAVRIEAHSAVDVEPVLMRKCLGGAPSGGSSCINHAWSPQFLPGALGKAR